MGLDIKTLAASKKYTKETATGAGAIQGQPGKDGKDAPTIAKVDVDENNVLLITLTDGSTLPGGTIKTVKGEKGEDGISIPKGGKTGQILVKKSENDYDTEWEDDLSETYKIIQGIL